MNTGRRMPVPRLADARHWSDLWGRGSPAPGRGQAKPLHRENPEPHATAALAEVADDTATSVNATAQRRNATTRGHNSSASVQNTVAHDADTTTSAASGSASEANTIVRWDVRVASINHTTAREDKRPVSAINHLAPRPDASAPPAAATPPPANYAPLRHRSLVVGHSPSVSPWNSVSPP